MGSEARVEVEVRKLFYLIGTNDLISFHKIDHSTYHSIISTAQVTKLWGDENISTAVVHPVAAAEGCEVRKKFPLR